MPTPTSYICERTAEYALIPELAKNLRSNFKFVTPIYPWISREGSNISLEVHTQQSFKVLGLYARRPKFLTADDTTTRVKFNDKIIRAAHLSLELGIPMIAGCPLARNFLELGTCKNFLWADLSKFTREEFEITIEIDEKQEIKDTYKNLLIQNQDEIFKLIESKSRNIGVKDLIQTIKSVEANSRGYGKQYSMAFMGGYKPVYFLLSDN